MTEKSGLTAEEITELSSAYAVRPPQDLLQWTLERFGSRAALCTSLQADGMVLLDMAWRLDPTVRVFTIDTGRLPQETYTFLDQVRETYGIDIEVHCPDATEVGNMVHRHGANLFYRDVQLRLLCCQVRKVHVLRRVLPTLDAWITGLRRDQAETRATIHTLELEIGRAV